MIKDLQQYHQVNRIQHQIYQRADCVAFRQWTPAGESQLSWQQVGTHINHICQRAAVYERRGSGARGNFRQ
ncbi:Uncharacterised protein [Serratia odorifera]|uniref:Uncharacterized protein n=1 Tax=Serratia odorifera TaxID=618 RepID=A0A447KLU3_SEROD|nr:Uncharacterised protein [Serratia odorifera]